ncbi:hypothetical protein BH708_02360 [Brachybacterium sp. P6-10-X1]|uniref:hypothetical protein n=1 Tax=Brachybacterium sp. P6-10-X1 TaxID=1903186 RepID=UPI00097191AC|nr:hypothetical protein [Brachybacterium sp. P6-10-X1]APX31751.1 hypothetical protein BH708_02360 [Brachybacterium sp. P6-10-X1]
MSDSRGTLTAGTSRLDEHARNLGRDVLAGETSQHEAACQVLADAVEAGVVAAMCARHHRGLAAAWDTEEITSSVTSMLVDYAVKTPRRAGHLDVTRFADGATSASGWVGKVIGAMRPTRILREMHAETSLLTDPETLEQAPAPSAEEQLLSTQVPEVQEHTKGMPTTSATVRLIHASALHELLGLPPLRTWALTPSQRREVLSAVSKDPQLPTRVLTGATCDVDDGPGSAWIRALWEGWSRDDVDAMAALSSPARDIPHLLCHAALRPLPRPTARSGQLERIRARVREAVPFRAAPAVMAALETFIDAEVETYTDFDRIRRPLTAEQRSRRDASPAALPDLCVEAARQIGITSLDVLSGLIGALTEPLPVVDARYFTPTSWRFPT